MINSFPKTLFRTPNPKFEVSEMYEISIEPVPGAIDLHECWIVREMHGYFEETSKTFLNVLETVHPVRNRGFLTCAEAIQEANDRVLFLAQNGFRFLFVTSYSEPTPPWYECVEVVLPTGEYRPVSQLSEIGSVGEPVVQALRFAH